MYIWDCSRSVGVGKAITRKTRGLTRSVIALIVPPLPAPSRPSNRMQTFRPLCRTHSCNFTSSTWSLLSSRSYSLPLSSLRSAAAVSLSSSSRVFISGSFPDQVPINVSRRLLREPRRYPHVNQLSTPADLDHPPD